MATKEETLELLREQLDGLSTAVAGDEKFVQNQADYMVTLASLKKRIEEAHKMPDVLIDPGSKPRGVAVGGTQTGRVTPKNPLSHSDPRVGTPPVVPAVEPKTDRRAAIQHTRKLNELGNDS